MLTDPQMVQDVCHTTHNIDLGFLALGWWDLTVLGVVQGITELLPISSTAHMRVVPALMGVRDPGSAFSAAMQLASTLAVIVYFLKDIKTLTVEATTAFFKKDWAHPGFKLAFGIGVGTIPIGVFGLLMKPHLNACNTPWRALWVIGVSSIVMSLLLAASELFSPKNRPFERVTFKDCVWVGLAQVLALIPGVSRSGSTITAGLALGMNRETAARFSFLLGLPAIILAGLLEVGILARAGLTAQGWVLLSYSLLVATVSAFVAVFALMRYLEKRSLWVFVLYRFLMGVGVLWGSATGLLH